ncbi:2-oxoglutarate dehydrogenase [Paenibacillus swuensis]|uniref:2-oxoglutarate dehydrogenase E1 component n=1 Tax=Paenibacillus swuensis TaxID=1178515 RepID=A0A172TIN5_9BACL|nr:2-oxoglutarate dehydrogenase E1 component [Paenibacillus swuensis]ANE46929.1 2-oxoglutarate dehydrogenase [Paenibacillus swuensis]
MSNNSAHPHGPWQAYLGPNLGYIQEQYDLYLADADSVIPEYRELFDRYGEPPQTEGAFNEGTSNANTSSAQPGSANSGVDPSLIKKAFAAGKLATKIRAFGHLAANLDPLGILQKPSANLIEPETYGLNPADLAALPAEWVWEDAPGTFANGWEAINKLRAAYSGTIAYEFSHVHNEQERGWLTQQAESVIPNAALDREERVKLLNRLLEAEQFEDFLQRTFVGQKRFSIEGNDVLVALVDEIVHELANDGAKNILMGMAHRGRLNVLAHVLGKPYSKIFSEFHHSPNKNLIPSEGSTGINYGWTGDVKYHLGANRSIPTGETAETRLTLANNPSHLEYVNPVVGGFTRAAQEDRSKPGYPVQQMDSAASIIMHGDAAFSGEGIVAETLNFNNLRGFSVGGTIHIIVNNNVGFTTDSWDSRSTHYASDLAKGFEIPIVHVNADDPEAVIAAARMASEYRTKFKKDFLIDLIGYRRYGHNETDDPETTQPLVYQKVRNHPTVSKVYAEKLIREHGFTAEETDSMKAAVQDRLKTAYDEMKAQDKEDPTQPAKIGHNDEESAPKGTAVPLDTLRRINEGLLRWPEKFNVYPKLKRILERRASSLDEGQKVDWGHAETLAFASILADGRPIRITGQDAERATFAHRNLVLSDSVTGEKFCPLHVLPEAKASFAIHNSSLSEAGVLGFEYGYNVFSPETMVIWEAQYGDFVNCAQVLIDQFISAGRSKWSQKSGITMLLPHGFEGQGPEHSSGRLERFLQLCGQENWTVANLTSASQYFHLLRRQASTTATDEARPLIVMAPKSLIRNPRATSDVTDLSEGSFRLVVEQPGLGQKPEAVERLLLCTGKMAIDLEDALEKEASSTDWLHIVRVEQLYPLPVQEIKAIIARFPKLKEIVWVQEEPRNMGSWSFMEPRIRELAPDQVDVSYIGRPDRASPATGYQVVHVMEQGNIITKSFTQQQKFAVKTGR